MIFFDVRCEPAAVSSAHNTREARKAEDACARAYLESMERPERAGDWTLERATGPDHPNAYGYTVVLVCPHRLCGLTSAVRIHRKVYVSGESELLTDYRAAGQL